MAGDLYLRSYNFGFIWTESKQTSAGAADAGRLVALNANGGINASLLDFSLGAIVSNLGLGVGALALATGFQNVALGYGSNQVANAAADNTSVGYQSLKVVTTGASNSVLGSQAGVAVTSGANNALLGYRAGLVLTSGNANTLLGSQAGVNITTGSLNVVAGYLSQLGSAADNNSIVLGANVVGLGSNTAIIGDANITRTYLQGIVQGPGVIVANLPAPVAGRYARAIVTDANATLTAGIGAVVAGGGANIVPVFTNGVDWRIG